MNQTHQPRPMIEFEVIPRTWKPPRRPSGWLLVVAFVGVAINAWATSGSISSGRLELLPYNVAAGLICLGVFLRELGPRQ